MEPIYVHSNQYQPSGSDPDAAESNAYTLTLSQTVLPDRADEIASVVARSPIDRFEHTFHFDSGDEYLAWTIATDAQRKATHLGYDAARTGIEAIVIAPDEQYGRLDDFFTSQPSMTPSRLVVYKQNVLAGETLIKEHLGPDHQDRFVGAYSNELAAQSAGRALLSDLVKAYAKNKVAATLDETRHPYNHSLGFQKRGLAKSQGQTGLGTVELDQLAKVELPGGYAREDFYQDAHAVKAMVKDMARQAGQEASGQDYDTASQAYGFASELQDLYDHLRNGRHEHALNSITQLSPYLLDDLPHRLYEHLEFQVKPPLTPTAVTPIDPVSMRYTRVDLEGRVGHFASMTRKRDSDTISVELLCPDLQRTHHVQAGSDSREDQESMAEGLQEILDGYKGNKNAVSEYYDAVIRLAD